MIVERRFSFDTNILVYSVDRDAGERYGKASTLLDQASAGERGCVLTLQALGEFFKVATQKSLLEAAEAKNFVLRWSNTFPIAMAGEKSLADAMDAAEKHQVSFWGAMLLASARLAGCSAVISENMQHGRRLDGIEIINPFAVDAAPRLRPLGLSV